MIAVLERVQAGIIGETLTSIGILGLYITVVLAIGRFLRFSTKNMRMRIQYEDLPDPRQLVTICQVQNSLLIHYTSFRQFISFECSHHLQSTRMANGIAVSKIWIKQISYLGPDMACTSLCNSATRRTAKSYDWVMLCKRHNKVANCLSKTWPILGFQSWSMSWSWSEVADHLWVLLDSTFAWNLSAQYIFKFV